jgi:hypothetical protein
MSEVAEEIIEDAITSWKMILKAVSGVLVIPTAAAYVVYLHIKEEA